MSDEPCKARRPLTPRSAYMIIAGILWIMVGWGVHVEANTVIPQAFHTVIEADIRALGWAIPGFIAIVAAVTMRRKGDALALLALVPIVHFVFYLGAWVVYLLPLDVPGVGTGWYQAILALFPLGCVLLIAKIPPSRPASTPQEG